MHLGGTARRIALTAAQCYSFIYKYKKLTIRYYYPVGLSRELPVEFVTKL